jgi:hypothetical protein
VKAALRNHNRLICKLKISNKLFGINIDNSRANRHFHNQVIAAATCAVAALTSLASLRAVTRLKAEVYKRIQACVCLQEHAATVAAIATVGPAPLYIFFAPKTQRATAAASSLSYDFCFIYEFHFFARYKKAPSGDEAL